MIIKFYTSCAGIAGDPDKLLVAEVQGYDIRELEMYDTTSWFNHSFYRAKKKLLKRIKNQIVELC